MIQQGSIDFRIDWLGTEKTKKKENDGTVDVVTNDARRGRRQRRVDDPDGRRRRRHLGRRGHAGRDGVGLCRAALPLPRPAAARPRPLVLRPTGPHGPLLLLQERREQRLLFFFFFSFFFVFWFGFPGRVSLPFVHLFIVFFFSQNFVFVIFWYQLYCGFSGTVMVDQLYQMFFNLFFTSLPPLAMGESLLPVFSFVD